MSECPKCRMELQQQQVALMKINCFELDLRTVKFALSTLGYSPLSFPGLWYFIIPQTLRSSFWGVSVGQQKSLYKFAAFVVL